MKRSEIEDGKTYSNAKGTIHRRVDELMDSHKVYRMAVNDGQAVRFTVTKGQSNRYSGKGGKCTMAAFAQWAKSKVSADG